VWSGLEGLRQRLLPVTVLSARRRGEGKRKGALIGTWLCFAVSAAM
jgi:hypothetical protein